jgi:hypothetical protein
VFGVREIISHGLKVLKLAEQEFKAHHTGRESIMLSPWRLPPKEKRSPYLGGRYMGCHEKS